jgi:hypothetical protein
MQPHIASRLAERIRPWFGLALAGTAVVGMGLTLGFAAVHATAVSIGSAMVSHLAGSGSASVLAVFGITLGPLGLTFPCWATNAPSWKGRRRLPLRRWWRS